LTTLAHPAHGTHVVPDAGFNACNTLMSRAIQEQRGTG
jgi:hypothetical protein